jgi:hypothetical protein
MKNLTLFLALFLIFSCSDYVEPEKKSSDGKFSVIAKVNRTDKNAEFYAEPIFEIYDSKKQLITKIESGAGDFSRWEVGWSEKDNILIMYSSDIGNKAWEITDNGIEKTELTAELNTQAEKLIEE